MYSGRRLYQYKEDDFRIKFSYKLSCLTAWIHKHIKMKRNYQFKKDFFHNLQTCNSKKPC